MTQRNVADMTQRELEAIIFDGAEVYELRGPGDAFTLEELSAILDAPVFPQFDSSFQSWIFNAWDAKVTA